MEAFYLRLYITCIFGAEIYKCYGKKYYFYFIINAAVLVVSMVRSLRGIFILT